MVLALALAALLQGTRPSVAPAAAFAPARTREAITVDSLEAAELRFFYEWGDAYSLSQDYRLKFGFWSLRQAMIECTIFQDRKLGKTRVVAWKGRIPSAHNSYTVCPSWALSDSIPHDESIDIDQALDVRFRESVKRARESMIAVFATATAAFPRNDWIVGQYIRLLVDQRALDRALVAARDCRARAVWCSELTGLVLTQLGDFAAADAAFARALGSMSADERCRWTDARVLLDSAGRRAYGAMPCAARESVDARLWWLADPLWSEAGNERRAVQYARTVALALRTSLIRDERWSWLPQQGGDALDEMFLRYGWPSFTFWAGLYHDAARTGRYLVPLFRGAVNPPYTTYEYPVGRVQTFPSWSAIDNPLYAKSTDWMLSSTMRLDLGDPADTLVGGDGQPLTMTEHSNDVVERTGDWWWPSNHFAPRVAMRQLPDGERAFLRRQNNAIIALFVDANSASTGRANGVSADATLISTTRPDSFRTVAHARGGPGNPFVLFGNIDAQRSLIGVEIPGDSAAGLPAARTRYPIAPPAPLSAMRAGERAISDLVMLRAATDGAELPVATDAALGLMRSSTLTAGTPKFGVYWETYGFAPTDTAEIAVWVERFTPQGILRNLGIAIRVATDLNTPVAHTWTETGLGRNANVIAGPVTIIGRSITLDASALQPGDYWLDVVVRQPGKPAVQSRRAFTVQR